MLAARRGLGAEEQRLAMPRFLAAVRWATFAGEVASTFREERSIAKTDPSRNLLTAGGPDLIEFRANRERAKATVAELEAVLFPPDPEPSDG